MLILSVLKVHWRKWRGIPTILWLNISACCTVRQMWLSSHKAVKLSVCYKLFDSTGRRSIWDSRILSRLIISLLMINFMDGSKFRWLFTSTHNCSHSRWLLSSWRSQDFKVAKITWRSVLTWSWNKLLSVRNSLSLRCTESSRHRIFMLWQEIYSVIVLIGIIPWMVSCWSQITRTSSRLIVFKSLTGWRKSGGFWVSIKK